MKSYVNTIARNHFCVPAILCTILRDEGYDISQEIIAEILGITVPIDAMQIVSDMYNINYSDNDIEWGVKLEHNSINNLFSKLDVKLHETFIPINTISEDRFIDVLAFHFFSGEHIICGFNYSSLYSLPPANYGHVSLVCDIEEKDRIILLDPGPKNVGQKTVLADDLYIAIRKRADGLWCISRTG